MQRDRGTGVHTRSLDELADIAVRRGDRLRRRRRQLRAVPGAALAAVVLVLGVLLVDTGGDVSTVDTRPADRIEEDREPAETRTGDDASRGSDVEVGGAPTVDRSDVAPDADAPVPDELSGRIEIGPPHILYVSGLPGGQPALWQFDRRTGVHVERDDADLCRPAVSHPDGAVAYCRQGAIVVRDAGGGSDHRVVASQAADPDFAPSGERLAYVDRSTGRDVIWTVGVDGSDRRKLTSGLYDDRFPTWSPDGSQVAFVRGSSVSRSVWIVASDGSGAREVSARFSGLDAFPLDWSPDGRLLAFTCLSSLTAVCFLDVATGEWRAVTPEWLQATSPSWSPDGSVIAFTAHPRTTTATSEVWVMRGDGTEERRLWPGRTFENPAWYPVFLPDRPN